MKLKTTLPQRRDGSFPRIETGHGKRGAAASVIVADDAGMYDVPDERAADLIATGNFYPADGSVPVVEESEPSKPQDEQELANGPAGNVIVNGDVSVNLDDMTRAELVEFAAMNFDVVPKANDNKATIIAAIMAAVKAD